MHLVSAKVGPFKSIENPIEVHIEPAITVLVGMNEAGKTVFLQALQKTDDIFNVAKFDLIEDYPRKNLNAYEKRHDAQPDIATRLTYQLSDTEVDELNQTFHTKVSKGFQFSVTTNYKNKCTIGLNVDHKPVLAELAKTTDLSTEFRNALKGAGTVNNIPKAIEGVSLNDADKKLLESINQRIAKSEKSWPGDLIGYEVYQWLDARTPRFMYFGDYEVLPSKMNLADLASRVAQQKDNPAILTPEHRGILALLRMANISADALSNPGALESLISRIEAVSINLTDQIMAFWKQNEDLQVKIDIRNDPNDQAPYNNGQNLYIRIANNRHRGVSTPFKQRSRGFIWFFSFLVWFDSVQQQLQNSEDKKRPLILLLDEPGLSLHALAQADFLRYIDDLGQKHQVIYSTHSPFMIHSHRLQDVRVVEDREKIGTTITDNVSWTDERTIFPLQAALGWTIAQNLFISERNLLVEGATDLVYLQTTSALLEAQGKAGLRTDITIVPTGGLDKVVTFIALLGANKLKLAVFHDYRGTPEQKLIDLMKEKMISSKQIFDASQFRGEANGKPSDLEDLFEADVYLHYFNAPYAKELKGKPIKASDLPPGDRIVERLERLIAQKKLSLRSTGGFNHYLPAVALARDPSKVDEHTMARFADLFEAVNSVL